MMRAYYLIEDDKEEVSNATIATKQRLMSGSHKLVDTPMEKQKVRQAN